MFTSAYDAPPPYEVVIHADFPAAVRWIEACRGERLPVLARLLGEAGGRPGARERSIRALVLTIRPAAGPIEAKGRSMNLKRFPLAATVMFLGALACVGCKSKSSDDSGGATDNAAAPAGTDNAAATAEPAATEAPADAPAPPATEQPENQGVAPSANHIWTKGYWRWQGGRYVWINGSWQARRAGMTWVAGHWQARGKRHVWIPGHWRR